MDTAGVSGAGFLADVGRSGDHRIVAPLSQLSPDLIKATLAIEDRTFYHNVGLDLAGIVRAAVADLTNRRITQGASTITQQLAKQLFLGPNPAPSLQRKLREAVLALELNDRYSKNQILELYLNTIYYGSQAYGVEAAVKERNSPCRVLLGNRNHEPQVGFCHATPSLLVAGLDRLRQRDLLLRFQEGYAPDFLQIAA